ncbi:MAG TPA: TlpA disulfide reductase family protein [Bryobacteraceae bacterium]|nr:TlpA disulfide reductase family protein [Bryobacteraceae bacterium]
MRFLAAFALMIAALAPTVVAQAPPPDPDLQQQYELSLAINDAANSPVDIIRNLEAFLKKYPAYKKRSDVEQALAKTAVDSNDEARIVLYGEKVLANGTKDDMTLIDRVTRALVDSSDPDQLKKSVEYAKRYEADVLALRQQSPPGHLTAGQWSDEVSRALARALVLEAHAVGNTTGAQAGADLAKKSWNAWPTAEGAREVAYWLVKLDRSQEAIEYYADAFALQDSRTTDEERAKDRKRLGELYSKLNGSEKGLGDVTLQAYDRTSVLLNERHDALKAKDPNIAAADIEDFVLPAVESGGQALELSSLKGKTVVMEFWATWCVPCRAQHPLIENVKKHFADAKDVVFVAVDADDDPSVAAPFAKEQGWNAGYFEAGLAQRMVISSIPTVLVLDPAGRLYSRMVGFVPERFEQMLTDRVEEARKNR